MKKHIWLVTLLFCALLLIGAAAAEQVVYVSDGGNGDGTSASAPLGDLAAAYNALGDAGGRIVLVGTYTLNGHLVEPAHAGLVTLTQEIGGTSYRTADGAGLLCNGKRYVQNGPTAFENITLRGLGAETVKNNGAIFVAQFHPITIGEGVVCADFGNYAAASNGATIVGGTQNGADKYNSLTDDLDSHITVKSGKFNIVAFSRQVSRDFTGMAHIDISGGEVPILYFGSINNGTGGAANVRITGGSFTNKWYAGTSSKFTGNLTVTVKGGDFSALTAANGQPTGTVAKSRIDLSTLPAEQVRALKAKLAGFNEIVTEAGTTSNKIPEEVFLAGSFTATDGTTIPYRYYLPEGYQTSGKTYPVFLYMHGNGSRGSDNVSQLTTNGAALNTAVLNSDYACIMIAPQCPAHPAEWIDRNAYPGSDAFAADLADGKLETRNYLNAAMELLNSFITDKTIPADTSRIYVTGSSNGGGAAWAMAALHPHVFAAAIPMCGTGNSLSPVTAAGANALVPSYLDLPIWTFHGDADTTLSIEGTRGIVNAVKASGGTKINFTVIPGGSHDIVSQAAGTDGLIDWIFAQKNENFRNTLMPVRDPMDANGDGKVDLQDVLTMLADILRGSSNYSLNDVTNTLKQLAQA